ncbi:MAG: ribbon-helix-helix protein, CopG family [Deltaproteobacteria bacterium]|nr:ribbon-helix-helix protein, CopG family [Deltaproteobacteria bacterium]
MNIDMAAHKRVNISLHPEDLEKLDMIAKKRGYKRSPMIARLIQEYKE